MPRRVLLASMSLLLIAALSACSTKSAVTEAVTDTTAAGSPATTGGDATDTTASSAVSGDTSTSVAAADITGPAGSLAGSCPTQAQVDSVQSELEAGSSGATSSEELGADYDAAFSFLATYLPADRQADLEVVRNAFSGYVQALSGVDLSNPDALSDDQYAALDAAGKAFDTPEVEAANSRIEDYFTQTCPDVNFNSGSGTTGDTTPN